MRLLRSELVGTASQELGWNILLKDLSVEKYHEYTSFLITSSDVIATCSSQWQNIDQILKVHNWALPMIYVKTKIQEMGLIFGGYFPSSFITPFTKLKWQNASSKPSELWSLANLFFMCWMEYCSLYFIILYLWIYYYGLVISLTLCWYFFCEIKYSFVSLSKKMD